MEKIEKLEIINDPYFGSTSLLLFPNGRNISVVYGKNGSGKTSISNGINEYLSNNPNYILKSITGNAIPVINRNRVFIFNEEYIDKKVKLSGDAIGTIVLFGDTGDIETEIKRLEKNVEDEKDKINSRDVEKYNRKGDESCIDDYLKKIEQNLQTNWASRQQKIRKGSRKSPVTNQLIEEIISTNITSKNKTDLITQFNDKLLLLDKAAQSEDRISDIVILENITFDEKELVRCLNESYEKREMSDLAKNLLISYEHYKCLEITKTVINADDDFCPVCLRPLDKSHTDILSRVIDEAFDDTVRNAKAGLDFFLLNKISIDLSKYEKYLEANKINKLKVLIDDYNRVITQYCELKELKLSKIYDSVNTPNLDIQQIRDSILDAINNANIYIGNINDAIDKNKENVEYLLSINKLIAAIEVNELSSIVKNLRKKQQDDNLENRKSETKIEEYKSEILKLRAKEKDIHVAMNEINNELSIIFSSKNRLKLVPDATNTKYYVESNGHKVRLNKLSTGERNLIALIYFFEEMKHECKKDEYFRDEYFIVIDDPISSFDYENKLGVYSYLNKMIGMVFNGNVNSQMMILSHERDVIYYLIKMLDKHRLHNGAKIQHVSLRINGRVVENFDYAKKADYTYLLNEAFQFASIEKVDSNFESKGNGLRKLVEMYATFNYKVGIEELFTKKEILSNITDEELRNFYSNSMFWMPLNADSHTQELALQYPNFDTFDLFSEEEQIKVAREILCYLYLIHENHITSHFNRKDVHVISNWVAKLKAEISASN